MLKNLDLFSLDELVLDESEGIRNFCLMLKNMMDTNNISLEMLIKHQTFNALTESVTKNKGILDIPLLLK